MINLEGVLIVSPPTKGGSGGLRPSRNGILATHFTYVRLKAMFIFVFMLRTALLSLIILSITSCSDKSAFNYVDPFIGTGGHGHTFPGSTMPFGMVQLSPDTRLTGWDGCSGYHYSDSIIYGFSHTHLSGTGVSDYGDILLMPYSGETFFNNGSTGQPGYNSVFQKSTEFAQPGYYHVVLDKHNIEVELTTSNRVGFHRYYFNDSQDRRLMIDLAHRDQVLSSDIEQVSDLEIIGHRHSKAWAQNQYVFFKMAFDHPIISIEILEDSLGTKAALYFGEGAELLVKVALSAVDEDGASRNLEAEVSHWDFELVRNETKEAWETQLNKIEVSGRTESQMRVFYTALYHTMIAPNLHHDVDGRYRGTDLEIHQDQDFTNYTVFSLWDTYRSTHPLYTIIQQDRTNDFINTFLKQYQQGGRLPMWELACNYTSCMIGYHAVPVIADAYIKGIRGYDEDLALESMLHSSMQTRLGIDAYRQYGFIPMDKESESVSKTLEYAYDDWTIAVMAEAIGKKGVVNTYYDRAQYYKNMFDPTTGFMRAKDNNRWFFPFDPAEVNFHYTEANSWQYSFYVPQDVNTWIDMIGGDQKAEEKLDALFNASSETTGRTQSDITGLIGQYAHGNEPSHHIPYLYNYVGRPDKTQKLVRQIMDELYSDQPDGLSGNEDCGQMSSWLVMSALGFYPVAPGSEDYILGSPWFENATIHLENGNDFTINAAENSPNNIYVQNGSLNGHPHSYSYLKHSDIMNGGELALIMGGAPSEFGVLPQHRPVSRIENQSLPIPSLLLGDMTFTDSTQVELYAACDCMIQYSFTEDDSIGTEYDYPITLYEATELYMWSEKGGQKSIKAKSEFFKIPKNRSIELLTEYESYYSAGGEMALIDFMRGGDDFRTGAWQGYDSVNLEAVIDLSTVETHESISITFLQDENSWIFMPTKVEFFASKDGEHFELLSSIDNTIHHLDPGIILHDFKHEEAFDARFIKVIGYNMGECPTDHKCGWHNGDGYIFADEIVIY
jgi:predicted alpha-1,2-mannosidase